MHRKLDYLKITKYFSIFEHNLTFAPEKCENVEKHYCRFLKIVVSCATF